MNIVRGQTALITGASKGLGVHIAQTLAAKGMNLVLAARSQQLLDNVRKGAEECGVKAIAVPTDVSDPNALEHLVTQALDAFGAIDVLVNNAGIEYTATYDTLTLEDIERIIRVNLTAPMVLTRLVLPDMLRRNHGHIVNMSSVAGVLPTSYTAPYAATKYGLVGFTRSLRLTAQEVGSAVSASVVCPGFMDETGMYETMKQQYQVKASRLIGSQKAQKAADAVMRAIENDVPEVVVMPGTPRLFMACNALMPRFVDKMVVKLRLCSVLRETAEQRAQQRS